MILYFTAKEAGCTPAVRRPDKSKQKKTGKIARKKI
jgi:hypothetical protein